MPKESVLKALSDLGLQNDHVPMDQRLDLLRKEADQLTQEEFDELVKGPGPEVWLGLGIATYKFVKVCRSFYKILLQVKPLLP